MRSKQISGAGNERRFVLNRLSSRLLVQVMALGAAFLGLKAVEYYAAT
jgi:hypothetical protein